MIGPAHRGVPSGGLGPPREYSVVCKPGTAWGPHNGRSSAPRGASGGAAPPPAITTEGAARLDEPVFALPSEIFDMSGRGTVPRVDRTGLSGRRVRFVTDLCQAWSGRAANVNPSAFCLLISRSELGDGSTSNGLEGLTPAGVREGGGIAPNTGVSSAESNSRGTGTFVPVVPSCARSPEGDTELSGLTVVEALNAAKVPTGKDPSSH